MNALRTRSFQVVLATALVPALAAPAYARTSVPPPAAAGASLMRARAAGPDATELTARLQEAIDATNEDPEVHAPALRRVLDELAGVPGVVGRDPRLQSLRIEGLLYLARALLVLDDRDGAVGALDEAIRVSGGSVSNVGDFGPSLSRLYDERRTAPELRPAGEVHVECTGGPCRVFLDGRVIGTGTDIGSSGIPLGSHVIRIEPQELEPPEPFTQEVITLSGDQPRKDFTLELPVTETPTTATGPTKSGDSGRKLPRWAGILGMTLGGVAMAGGAFAIAIDGRCPDLSAADANDGNACRDVHNSLYTGIGVLAAGAGALTGFGIAFGLGEAKDKRHAASAAPQGAGASVQMRFRF